MPSVCRDSSSASTIMMVNHSPSNMLQNSMGTRLKRMRLYNKIGMSSIGDYVHVAIYSSFFPGNKAM